MPDGQEPRSDSPGGARAERVVIARPAPITKAGRTPRRIRGSRLEPTISPAAPGRAVPAPTVISAKPRSGRSAGLLVRRRFGMPDVIPRLVALHGLLFRVLI